MIKNLHVNRLQLMGFSNIKYKDIEPRKYKNPAVVKFRKLDDKLNKRSKAIKSSSTTDPELIELMDMTFKDIDTTVNYIEQDTPFIEADERDKLIPLRELEGVDKQLRTIRGSLEVAIAKRIDLEDRIKHQERKLN